MWALAYIVITLNVLGSPTASDPQAIGPFISQAACYNGAAMIVKQHAPKPVVWKCYETQAAPKN